MHILQITSYLYQTILPSSYRHIQISTPSPLLPIPAYCPTIGNIITYHVYSNMYIIQHPAYINLPLTPVKS